MSTTPEDALFLRSMLTAGVNMSRRTLDQFSDVELLLELQNRHDDLEFKRHIDRVIELMGERSRDESAT